MIRKKPRPTAEDRDIANVLRKLTPGKYSLTVDPRLPPFMALARLKIEGSTEITFDDSIVLIVPEPILGERKIG